MQPQSARAQVALFKFTGTGAEYFRIWIANLFLTLITLGIYSAWAKVRRNRYFYGNTRLGNVAFQYLADPKGILKGRAIAVLVLVAYVMVSEVWPLADLFFVPLIAALIPLLVVKSLMFRHRNTAFRNIRFDFKGTYGQALRVFVLMPLLILFTLGLIIPYLQFLKKKFLVDNSAYGTTRFTFSAKPRDFYRASAKIGLLALVSVLAVTPAAGFYLNGGVDARVALSATGVVGAILLLFLLAYVKSRMANLVYNNIAIDGHPFQSDFAAGRIFGLYLTNVLGMLLTLGLFLPWAQVRMARYQAAHLCLVPNGDIRQFLAAEQIKVQSLGEEMSEMMDVDVAI